MCWKLTADTARPSHCIEHITFIFFAQAQFAEGRWTVGTARDLILTTTASAPFLIVDGTVVYFLPYFSSTQSDVHQLLNIVDDE
jgi:hypothetical protein